MDAAPDSLKAIIEAAVGTRAVSLVADRGELTLTVAPADYLDVMRSLRDGADTAFELLIDLCGIDYAAWRMRSHEGPRYAVVVHLLSVRHNRRLRVRVHCADDALPVVASVVPLWTAANWFEREAFDFYGIVFEGHPDLRRLLTDYGFIGHPMRKDFPVSGHVEMRYDAEQKRVVYQPVTIEPREVTPRVVREDNYARGQ